MDQIQLWLGELKEWGASLQVFGIILAVLLANFIQRRFIAKLHSKLERTKNPWDDAFVDALSKPLSYLFWVVGLSFAIDVFKAQKDVPAAVFEAVTPLRSVAIIAIIVWFLIRVIKRVEENLVLEREKSDKPIDKTTVDAIGKLVKISVFITGVLMALQTLGFSISGILAFGGVGGVAVGFAAKDLLANFFGALVIYLDRPFAVGDWIRSPDKQIEGTVENIGWRLTLIRTFDKRPLYVPNSVFSNISVENPSRMTNRRIYETFGVRYDDTTKVANIVEQVKAMLKSHPEIDTSQTLIVNFNAFNSSSVDFFVYTFTKTTNWVKFHEIKQEVLLKIAEIVEQNDASFAFPTQTLNTETPLQFIGVEQSASSN